MIVSRMTDQVFLRIGYSACVNGTQKALDEAMDWCIFMYHGSSTLFSFKGTLHIALAPSLRIVAYRNGTSIMFGFPRTQLHSLSLGITMLSVLSYEQMRKTNEDIRTTFKWDTLFFKKDALTLNILPCFSVIDRNLHALFSSFSRIINAPKKYIKTRIPFGYLISSEFHINT